MLIHGLVCRCAIVGVFFMAGCAFWNQVPSTHSLPEHEINRIDETTLDAIRAQVGSMSFIRGEASESLSGPLIISDVGAVRISNLERWPRELVGKEAYILGRPTVVDFGPTRNGLDDSPIPRLSGQQEFIEVVSYGLLAIQESK